MLAAVAAVVARLWVPPFFDDASFPPFPDGLELAASAQSIAQDGRFLLHVGPNAVRSRYAPGFPLLLAGGLCLGVPPDRLVLIVVACDALLAAGAALAAMALLSALARIEGRPPPGAGISSAVGLVAGVPLALGIIPALVGKMLHSDPATNLMSLLALGAAALALGAATERLRLLAAGMAGLAGAWVLTSRPIDGVLLGVGALPLLLRAAQLFRARELLRVLVAIACGAGLPVALTMCLLAASGLSPFAWTGYAFWMPERFNFPGQIFGLRFAFGPAVVPILGGETGPGVLVPSSMLLGLPKGVGLGWVWPALGWAGLEVARRRIRRHSRSTASAAIATLLTAGLVWSLARALFFPFYFYASERFFLGPLFVLMVGVGLALGLAWGSQSRSLRAGAVLLLGAIAWDTWTSLDLRLAVGPARVESSRRRLAQVVTDWKELAPHERRQRRVPFDPVQAQALGWLDRETVEGLEGWGRLPKTYHVVRLRELGIIEGGARDP